MFILIILLILLLIFLIKKKNSLVSLRGLQNPSSSLTVDTSQSYSKYDDFLKKHNVKNVVDLLEPQEVCE